VADLGKAKGERNRKIARVPSADPKTTRARARACVILILTTLRCRIRISDSTPTQKWAFAPECSRFRCAFRGWRAPPPRPPAGHAAGPGPATGRVRGASETERGTGGVTLEGARHTRCPGSPSRRISFFFVSRNPETQAPRLESYRVPSAGRY
jgi:hypothetical protein